MVNLYELLKISYTASDEEIRRAVMRAAQSNAISIDTAQKAKEWLLDANMRQKYNAELVKAYPQILDEMAAQEREKAEAETLIQQEAERKKQQKEVRAEMMRNVAETSKTIGANVSAALHKIGAKTSEMIQDSNERAYRREIIRKEERKRLRTVNKSTYLIVALVFGFFGFQHWLVGRRLHGVLSFLFCLIFIPWIVSMVQIFILSARVPDENGNIVI